MTPPPFDEADIWRDTDPIVREGSWNRAKKQLWLFGSAAAVVLVGIVWNLFSDASLRERAVAADAAEPLRVSSVPASIPSAGARP